MINGSSELFAFGGLRSHCGVINVWGFFHGISTEKEKKLKIKTRMLK